MSYRKFKADFLFTGRDMLDDTAVLITDDMGKVIQIVHKEEAGENIEMHRGILCPGFINCHCHLELSWLKGMIPEKSGMINFLLLVMSKRNESLPEIREAIKKAEEYMLEHGIVAVGDICNTTDTLFLTGQSALYFHYFIEVAGFIESQAAARFEQALKIYDQFNEEILLSRSGISIVPHAPYSVSGKLFELVVHFPQNQLLTIHNQESFAENQFFENGNGDFLDLYKSLGIDVSFHQPTRKSSLQNHLPWFQNHQSVILVHNVATSEADLQRIANKNFKSQSPASGPQLFWCLCPNANLYINDQLPDIDLLKKYNCMLVIGTDSLASNNQLNILEELKTLQYHFPHLLLPELLQWATMNGAEALKVAHQFGSFTRGTKPGIVLVENVDRYHLNKYSTSRRIL
jgi:cytosine/adenosine deaminase-related metal-dependent hydrolase